MISRNIVRCIIHQTHTIMPLTHTLSQCYTTISRLKEEGIFYQGVFQDAALSPVSLLSFPIPHIHRYSLYHSCVDAPCYTHTRTHTHTHTSINSSPLYWFYSLPPSSTYALAHSSSLSSTPLLLHLLFPSPSLGPPHPLCHHHHHRQQLSRFFLICLSLSEFYTVYIMCRIHRCSQSRLVVYYTDPVIVPTTEMCVVYNYCILHILDYAGLI